MLDRIFSFLSGASAIKPAAIAKTSANGDAVDLTSQGNGADSLCFLIIAGAITDGTFTFTLQDSPDNSTWTNVPALYVQTGATGNVLTSATTAGTILKLGYLGNAGGASRYVRLVQTTSGSPATGGFWAAIALLGLQSVLPAA